MNLARPRMVLAPTSALLLLVALLGGCKSAAGPHVQHLTPLPPVDVPRELNKVVLPAYVIEPPDILLIDAVNVVPVGPHVIASLDVLAIQATPTFPQRPIDGMYVVDAEGMVNLGPAYGAVRVAGLTVDQASDAVVEFLKTKVENPIASVNLAQSAARQAIAGQHLVGPDGTVNLGTYGRVFVTGLTIEQARAKIESHLSRFLQQPQVSIDVAGYNSKSYYIITEGAGFGDGVARFPVTGNETVLDAIANINGMSQVSSKKVWIARPAPDKIGCDQILPVDWVGITKGGATQTNYQILPGDRVFIAEDCWVAGDTWLSKVLSPFERMFAFTLLGSQTIRTVNFIGSPASGGGFFVP